MFGNGDGPSHHPHHVRSFILRKDYSHFKDLAKRALSSLVLFRYFPTELLPPSDKQRDHGSLFRWFYSSGYGQQNQGLDWLLPSFSIQMLGCPKTLWICHFHKEYSSGGALLPVELSSSLHEHELTIVSLITRARCWALQLNGLQARQSRLDKEFLLLKEHLIQAMCSVNFPSQCSSRDYPTVGLTWTAACSVNDLDRVCGGILQAYQMLDNVDDAWRHLILW